MHIRYLTAGESHGKALTCIIEGIPSGLKLDIDLINRELARRMKGFGRGKRMAIEKDRIDLLSGVKGGKTLGSPISVMIGNKDHKIESLHPITSPRPGHADLAGLLKFASKDVREILERASARETAARVTVGSIAKIMLAEFNIDLLSHVITIGKIKTKKTTTFSRIKALSERSPVRCIDHKASSLMCREIKNAIKKGDTLGGIFEIIIKGVPPGIGSYTQWDARLDGNLAKSIMSVPGVKGIEIGIGFDAAFKPGSLTHDAIYFNKRSHAFYRKSNNAGGLEGGVSNGEDIILRAAMKPIATMKKPLNSIDIITKKSKKAQIERADVCAVPACGVISESMCAIEIAKGMREKFGGDSISEMKRNYKMYMKALKRM